MSTGLPESFRRRWTATGADPLAIGAWDLGDTFVDLVPGAARLPLRAWDGPPTDRCRLELIEVSFQGAGAAATMELELRSAYGCNAGVSRVVGTMPLVPGKEYGGMLVQATGILSTCWEVLGRIMPGGPPVRVVLRALVDRVGPPILVTKDLLS